MLRHWGGARELSPMCSMAGAAWPQRLTLPVPPQGEAMASKAVGRCQLPHPLHTYPMQRSSTSPGHLARVR